MSDGMLARGSPYGHITSRPDSWNVIEARICWRPFTTREARKSRTLRVSGAEKADGPVYVIAAGFLLVRPSAIPHSYPKLRLRSVPIAVVPGVGWRFLRQKWNLPYLMSYSAPSGFTARMIQISRL